MINILIIAYHFPPEMSGGVGRPYSLYKYFHQYGLQPTIITHHAFGHTNKEMNVYRFNSLRDWRNAHIVSQKVFLKMIAKIGNYTALSVQNDFVWQHNVKKAIRHLVREKKIEGIYATFPPIDTLLLGVSIAKEFRLPLLSEFRDGLLFEPLQKPYHIIHKIRIAKTERSIIDHSNVILTLGKRLSQYFVEKYPKKRTFTVYNGYDKKDFEGLRHRLNRGNKLKIAYFGSLSKSRKTDIRPLLMALSRLKTDELAESTQFELSFIGKYTNHEMRLVEKAGLHDIIAFYPPVPKEYGFRKIASEYTFLLFYGVKDQTTILSSKLFEYLKLDKPILAICKGNEAEEIIAKTGTGEVSDFTVNSIYALFRKFITGHYTYDPQKNLIATFDNRIQAGKIADIIKSHFFK